MLPDARLIYSDSGFTKEKHRTLARERRVVEWRLTEARQIDPSQFVFSGHPNLHIGIDDKVSGRDNRTGEIHGGRPGSGSSHKDHARQKARRMELETSLF